MQRQFTDWTTRLAARDDAADLVAAIHRLSAQLREVEDRLVQVEFTADGDSLNCRELAELDGHIVSSASQSSARDPSMPAEGSADGVHDLRRYAGQ